MPAELGVTVAVPVTDAGLAQPSPGCPPLAAQLAAFCDAQLSVTDWPTLIEVGAADIVTVGSVTATATLADALTS